MTKQSETRERVLDLDALASGPTLSVLGPPDGPYHAADNVVWELKRFPGVGERAADQRVQPGPPHRQ